MVPTFFPGYKNPKVITFKSIYSFWKHYMRGFLATLDHCMTTKNTIFILLDLSTRLIQHKKGDWFKTVNSDQTYNYCLVFIIVCYHFTVWRLIMKVDIQSPLLRYIKENLTFSAHVLFAFSEAWNKMENWTVQKSLRAVHVMVWWHISGSVDHQ